jgi:hypothetical protein
LVRFAAAAFGLDEVNVERAGEPRRDLILQDGNVRTIAVETIRPNVAGGLKIRKRYVDPDLVSGTLHRPLYGPANAKVLAERLKIDLLVLISKGRPAPDTNAPGIRARSVVKSVVTASAK